jgi:hypothetical protein
MPYATSVCGLTLIVYAALSYQCMQPYATLALSLSPSLSLGVEVPAGYALSPSLPLSLSICSHTYVHTDTDMHFSVPPPHLWSPPLLPPSLPLVCVSLSRSGSVPRMIGVAAEVVLVTGVAFALELVT